MDLERLAWRRASTAFEKAEVTTQRGNEVTTGPIREYGPPPPFFRKNVILKTLLAHMVQGCDSKAVTGAGSSHGAPVCCGLGLHGRAKSRGLFRLEQGRREKITQRRRERRGARRRLRALNIRTADPGLSCMVVKTAGKEALRGSGYTGATTAHGLRRTFITSFSWA